MLISDIDEYFVFPTRTMTLDLVLQKCTMNKAQVRLVMGLCCRVLETFQGPCEHGRCLCPPRIGALPQASTWLCMYFLSSPYILQSTSLSAPTSCTLKSADVPRHC